MSDFPQEAIVVLAPAIQAARRVLRDMDDDDVPESLRRIAASSSGKLPPPLARSLLGELDRNEWLRGEALDHGADDEASRAFLERTPGWWLEVTSAVAARRTTAVQAKVTRAEARVESLSAEVRATKAKLKQARNEAKTATASVKTDVAEARSRLENALAVTRAELDANRTELHGVVGALEDSRRREGELEARARRLEARVRTLRRELATVAAEAENAAASPPRTGLDLAEHVDLLAAMVPAPDTVVLPDEPRVSEHEPDDGLAVPPGVRPDSAEVITWLLDQPRQFALIVDGHNVLFHLDATTATSGEARRRLAADLAQFRARAVSRPDVVVVFDSHEPGPREPVYGEGVETLYADAGVAADLVVVETATEFSIPTVVVSSDRAVRDGAEAVAALALWSEALGEWLAG